MLFNSIDFAVFFPIVLILYWFVFNKNLKAQNLFIVVASYIFYGWWDWRFLFLIFFSTAVDYFIGLKLSKQENNKKQKQLLAISIIVNIGILGFFKYFNFFVDNFVTAFSIFGLSVQSPALHIILPVGISFYTFQTLSYTIDIYRKKLNATNDFVSFSAFVCFFPQLVAGPIERATQLLPQFFEKRTFDHIRAKSALKQILWGLFKKVVIADQCGVFVNKVFEHPEAYPGNMLILGAVFFAFQLYGDFSGYSDMAIGLAKLLGFKLSQNFAYPYFSRNFGEFWQRWHISLSSWFRDYIYIPLGGSRRGLSKTIRNTCIVFLLSGLWHGANWTFVFWGALNACFMLPTIFFGKEKYKYVIAYNKALPSVKEFFSMLAVFALYTFSLIFFRSNNIASAFEYIVDIFSRSIFELPAIKDISNISSTVLLLIFFIVVEWNGRREKYAIARTAENSGTIIRWFFYSVIVFLIGMYMYTASSPFIYFQF